MLDPMFSINERLINAQSMGASVASSVLDIAEISGFCAHFIWVGAAVGTVAIQGSNDNSNFVTVASQACGGATGQYLLNVEKQHYRYIKAIYTRTSGSGTLDCYVSGKR